MNVLPQIGLGKGRIPVSASLLAVIACTVCAFPAPALDEDGGAAYVKVIFSREGQPVTTSGCLSVIEHTYPDSAWWSKSAPATADSGPENAFREVVAAFLAKDKPALVQLSAPASREAPTFDRQAGAFFQQFEQFGLKGVPRSIQIDSLVVFFLTMEVQGKLTQAPLLFEEAGPGKYWFLPVPPKSVEFEMAKAWFHDLKASSELPVCSKSEVEKATFRVPLRSDESPATVHTSYLYLSGVPVPPSSARSEAVTRALAAFDRLKDAVAAYDGTGTLPELDADGAQRLKDWWATAEQRERKNYVDAITSEKPFYVFQLDPLMVLFIQKDKAPPHVVYLIPGRGGNFLWTNSAYGSTLDLIFKDGPLYQAARQTPPFAAWRRPQNNPESDRVANLRK